jgi:uncharacterized protein
MMEQKPKTDPYQHFSLTLVVNHACNLRCSYCYTGAKFSSPMPFSIGTAAIARAMNSLAPGGKLNLGFFGGEPLLEAPLISRWMRHARTEALKANKSVVFSLTTNGTITSREAWGVIMADDLELAVSFDASPAIHDRHRRDAKGNGTSAIVEATLQKLIEAGKPFQTVIVVRPDNLEELPGAIEALHGTGVRQINLSADVWTRWTTADGKRLEVLVHQLAQLWSKWLPEVSINWFDAKAGELARLVKSDGAVRCGFGAGEIAVAPSGRLYPCERLVGEDRDNNPLVLPGHAAHGTDFLECASARFARCTPCSRCALAFACDTTCRCSNYIRTGDVNRPDGLLCLLNKAAARAVAEILDRKHESAPEMNSKQTERCYA